MECQIKTQENCRSREIILNFVPRDGKEGVQFIEEILQNTFFCRHDIDLLNRQFDHLRDNDRNEALKKIKRKVDEIVGTGQVRDVDVINLIALYYLKGVYSKGFSISDKFNDFSKKCYSNPTAFNSIAMNLPTCGLEIEFVEDVSSLIGASRPHKIESIILSKRNELHDRAQKEVDRLRKKNPKDYPFYLDELFEDGYINLHQHLLQMKSMETRNSRLTEIEKMTFSYSSQVVLQMRDAIIRKVERAMPDDAKNILFLLGGSGHGKSTTLCFLRGDKMSLNGFSYESKIDVNHLIGHDLAASCTFLPTVEVTENCTIVDFPGFDDTNGPLISLGMECALKDLIEKYRPRIMVIESITNNEGRYAAAAKLGARLQRLLANKEDCLLGITKYSRDPDFGAIKALEERQQREMHAPSPEESDLNISIGVITKLVVDLTPLKDQQGVKEILALKETELKQNQQRLVELQKERLQQADVPVPNTPEKAALWKKIEEKEKELLKQLGIESRIRLDNLENPDLFSQCFTVIFEKNPISVNPQHSLDADHKKLIKDLFNNDLKIKTETVHYDHDIKVFEKNINEKSLIYTIFTWANPEIGKFLHLPEMDLSIAREFDKEIVDTCINRHINSLISEMDIPSTATWENEFKGIAKPEDIEKLKKRFDTLQHDVLLHVGFDLNKDRKPEEIEKKWKEIKSKVQSAIGQAEKEYEFPNWLKVMMDFLNKGRAKNLKRFFLSWRGILKQAELTAINLAIEDACTCLENMHQALLKLKELAAVINLKEGAVEVIKRNGLALESIDPHLKRNKEIVTLAVSQNGMALEYADSSLCNDKEIVLAAVKQNGCALQFAHTVLKKDKDVVIIAVSQNGLALQYADEVYKNGKQNSAKPVVLIAVQQNGLALAYVDAILKKDQEIVLGAIAQNALALQYADISFKKHKETVLFAVSRCGNSLQYADARFKADREVVFAAVQQDGLVLYLADSGLKCDRNIVLAAVKQNGRALRFAHDSLKGDREIVHAAVMQNGEALIFADEPFKKDEELVLQAIKKNENAIAFANENLIHNKEFVKSAVTINGLVLQFAKEYFQIDRDIVMAAIRQNHNAFRYAHPNLKKDKELKELAKKT